MNMRIKRYLNPEFKRSKPFDTSLSSTRNPWWRLSFLFCGVSVSLRVTVFISFLLSYPRERDMSTALPADQAANLLQKLSLDSQAKTFEVSDATEKASIDSGKVANGTPSDRSVTPILSDIMDPPVCYFPNNYASPGYYYSGYDGSGKEWDEQGKYMSSDGLDITPGVYGDSRSLMYHGYGYAPYGPYSPAVSPVPAMGHDQMYGTQPYQYPTPYFQSLAPSGTYPTMSNPAKGDVSTPAADQVSLSIDSTDAKSNGISNNGGNKINNTSVNGRAPNQSPYMSGGFPTSGYQDPRFSFDGLHSPIPWMESPYFSDGLPRHFDSTPFSNGSSVPSLRNQNIQHSQLYPRKLYGQNGNSYQSTMGYGSYGYDSRVNARDWMYIDGRNKGRGRSNFYNSYGTESVDGLNELNRGPRAKSSKNLKGFSPAAVIIRGQNIPLSGAVDSDKEKIDSVHDCEHYNLSDFPETYPDAKFFIIKSYSEDDVHKSVKYKVWSSTPNGNKKLDSAYADAQTKPGGCPVFLFFSVNASGQFVGVAEMVGPVDFKKNVEYWQQDKWIGCFPVKWHIVKDVPNNLLKHITIETNENKPVTNSRDTQEVKLEQGLQMLKIFKDHSCKQCILDDFDFYEDRQKRIQEKKPKQQNFLKQAQAWDGKHWETKTKESSDVVAKSVKVAPDSCKQSTDLITPTTADCKTTTNIAQPRSGETPKYVKPASDIQEMPENPIANRNGC